MQSRNTTDASDASAPRWAHADLPKPGPVSDLRIRFLSAVALGPLVLAILAWGGWAFTLLVAAVAAMGAREWGRMTLGHRAEPLLMALIVGFSVAASLVMAEHPESGFTLAVLAGIGITVFTVLRGIGGAAWAGFGVPYIAVGTGAVLWLRAQPETGLGLALFVVLAVWAADVGAYAAGRSIGGPKLWPRVSPKKTWAGLLGGMVTAGVFGAGTAMAFGADPIVPFALAAGLAVVGQAGDLFESAMKRRSHIKDSGSLIPGHGGLLDRIDAMLAAAPVLMILHLLSGGTLPWP